MPDETVRVVATFRVQAGQVESFLEAARKHLVEPTQGEPGCLEYDLWQDAAEPTQLAMLEAWESEEHLATHLAQPSLQAAVAKLAPMVAGPPTVTRLHRAPR